MHFKITALFGIKGKVELSSSFFGFFDEDRFFKLRRSLVLRFLNFLFTSKGFNHLIHIFWGFDSPSLLLFFDDDLKIFPENFA